MSQQNRTKMSVTQLTLLTAINMMGSGIVMLPTKLAEIGTISILSWLITAVGSLCLAYAFAKCGMFSKRPGMGGYSEYAFGKAGNFMANYTYGVSLLFANIAIAITCVGYGAEFLEIELSPVQVCLSTIVVLWICTSANFMGASLTGKFSALAVWCVILPVLLLTVIGWFWFSPTMYVEAWNPHNEPFFSAVGASISMTLWAFLGLESACANSDAVDNPEKNVPIAVLAATIGVAIIYISYSVNFRKNALQITLRMNISEISNCKSVRLVAYALQHFKRVISVRNFYTVASVKRKHLFLALCKGHKFYSADLHFVENFFYRR